MLKIWGRDNSVNVQKALWCCEEMGVQYQRIDAGGTFGIVNTPQYRALNPNGLVPTIEDGPFVLWESNTIVRYLTAKHSPGKLWPEDLKVRAEADKFSDVAQATKEALGGVKDGTTLFGFSVGLLWNTTTEPLNPQRGEVASLVFDDAGLGGDFRFYKIVAEAKKYQPLPWQTVLASRAKLSFADAAARLRFK